MTQAGSITDARTDTAVPGMAAEARDLLGVIEDELAAAGWPWNSAISAFVDHLVVLAEETVLTVETAQVVAPVAD